MPTRVEGHELVPCHPFANLPGNRNLARVWHQVSGNEGSKHHIPCGGDTRDVLVRSSG